jgi:hypothetical protein
MKPQHLKESQGAARRAHFAAGGTPKGWRGDPKTLDVAGSKAELGRRACRQKSRWDWG